jgi:tRNA-specific 2-thiouridylase
VKVRYRQADQPAFLEPRADGSMHIRFEHPQRAVTPGQYAVAYENDRCLGGGVIASATPVTLAAEAA